MNLSNLKLFYQLPDESASQTDQARPPPNAERSGIENCPFQPRVLNYGHLPDHMWPTLNLVLPANFQNLVVGQVLYLPVRMTVQVAPPTDDVLPASL